MGSDEWGRETESWREPEDPRGPGKGERHPPLNGWKIRFDAPPGDELSRLAESGDILSLFRAYDAAQHQLLPHVHVYNHKKSADDARERRQSPRYFPEETRAWIGWWHGSRFYVAQIDLVNLSKGGALIYLAERPPTSQPVWLCLGAPHPLEYVQARVLDACPRLGSAEYRARVDFHTPCPLGFFLAAGHKTAMS